ncbi:hypothetical protein Tcan_02223 [Toxocara canis]|uniref:Uncharacterized protein n=1 Tax=Toxocara canis TaxID=6265 RepID=A0A0B2UQQ4_TOXCA|nr:hypothetical protein Tcan_02223 [Toxocara canis]
MNTDRRSPCRSPPAGSGSPPGDPVVSSTEVLVTPSSSSPLERPSAPLPSPPITVLVKKALVDYDESDSDEEEESGESSLPSSSSSAGRPLSSPNSQLSSASTDEHDDVSSTSGDHEPSPGSAGEDDDGVEEHWEQNHDAVNDSGSLEIIRRKRAAKCEKASEPKVEGNNKGEEMAFQTGGKRLRFLLAITFSSF